MYCKHLVTILQQYLACTNSICTACHDQSWLPMELNINEVGQLKIALVRKCDFTRARMSIMPNNTLSFKPDFSLLTDDNAMIVLLNLCTETMQTNLRINP